MAIAVLDTFADSGATDDTAAGSFSVSSGTDRLLLYIQSYEGNVENITGVTWGGEAMTQAVVAEQIGSFDFRVRIWYLKDAGISAASGTSFSVTGATNGSYRAYAGSIENVDQENPVYHTGVVEGSLNSGDIDLRVHAQGFSLAVGGNGGAIDVHTWTNITERLENTSGHIRSLANDLEASTATITIDLNIGTGDGAQSMAAASFIPVTAASASVVSGGTANATNLQTASSSAAIISGGAANAQDPTASASASAAIVSGGSASATNLQIASAAAAIISGGTANGLRVKLASAGTPIVSGGSATSNSLVGVSALTEVVSGGAANADEVVPQAPPTPLANTFLSHLKAVILVDLLFDSGEVNIWTLPTVGTHKGKEYSPLAGVTRGLTVRNSLDAGSLDVSVQLSGQSEELLNIALTEPFQNRPAIVRLGNIITGDLVVTSSEILIRGTISNMPISDTREESTVSVLIDSVFRNLGQTETLRLSDTDQRLRNPDDSFFRFVETAEITTPPFGG